MALVAPDSRDEVLKHFRAWADAHISDGKVTVLGPKVNGIAPFDVVLFNVLEFTGSIDTSSLSFNVTVNLWVPIWGPIHLGYITGDLKDGLTLKVDLFGIATGSLKFYIQNVYDLWVSIDLNTVIGNWSGQFFLFSFK